MNTDLTPEEAAELSRRLKGRSQTELTNLLEEAGRRVFERAQSFVSEGSGGIGGFMDFTAAFADGPIESAGEFKGALWCEVLAILREHDGPGGEAPA
jgi:hypothetical protein